MGNHFHLVVETPKPTLVDGMKWLLGTYTQRFNARHRWHGHLFAGRYKSLLVDGSDDFYLRVVCDYVHLNPVRAGLVDSAAPLTSYLWSSYPWYLQPVQKRPSWLRTDRLLGEHGIWKDNVTGRKEFSDRMESRREEEDDGNLKELRRGWHFGAEDFLERLTALADKAPKADIHHAIEVRETMELEAEKIIDEMLKDRGLLRDELIEKPKGDPIKLQVAVSLRARTTMSIPWIAKALHAGSWKSLANALAKLRKYDDMMD